MRVHAVLLDGFDPLDVLGPVDVFAAGGGFAGGGVTVELVTADGPGPVRSGVGSVSLTATAALDPVADPTAPDRPAGAAVVA